MTPVAPSPESRTSSRLGGRSTRSLASGPCPAAAALLVLGEFRQRVAGKLGQCPVFVPQRTCGREQRARLRHDPSAHLLRVQAWSNCWARLFAQLGERRALRIVGTAWPPAGFLAWPMPPVPGRTCRGPRSSSGRSPGYPAALLFSSASLPSSTSAMPAADARVTNSCAVDEARARGLLHRRTPARRWQRSATCSWLGPC